MTIQLDEELARLLEAEAQRRGLEIDALAVDLLRQGLNAAASASTVQHSVMEFAGVGAGRPGALLGKDAQEYVNELRAQYGLRTPDALQLATAILSGCGAFLTGDKALRRVVELRVLVLDDLRP